MARHQGTMVLLQKPNNQRGWAWNTQEAIIQGVVRKAIEYDEGGIDIWPIRETSILERVGDATSERLLEVNDPKAALEYVRRFEHKLSSTPTRPLYAARVGDVVKKAIDNPAETKRTLFLLSTDGFPDPDIQSMTETTNQAITALTNAGLDPRRYLAHLGPVDSPIECDVANAMLPVLITALGGFDNPVAIAIALAGAISSEIDKALELIVTSPAKELMELMQAYVDAGHHREEY
ncbi:hypothetical protein IFR05_015221 [Cadophora sp. M221]|nr:hypothetical protein IFR05_015221 [Cadophora sp. M221]